MRRPRLLSMSLLILQRDIFCAGKKNYKECRQLGRQEGDQRVRRFSTARELRGLFSKLLFLFFLNSSVPAFLMIFLLCKRK